MIVNVVERVFTALNRLSLVRAILLLGKSHAGSHAGNILVLVINTVCPDGVRGHVPDRTTQ